MIPVANKAGDVLTEFIEVADEGALYSGAFPPLYFVLIVARYKGQALMVYNRRRQVWEVPGGGMEKEESALDCIVRELREESGQTAYNLRLRGFVRIRKKVAGLKAFAGALYSGELKTFVPFAGTDEIERICLWDARSELAGLCEIDAELVRLVKS